ncbi:MAG: hypothetical protein PHV16_01845 [Candidatus Nanoarchaeia archaeon]|nr:hypothetical protein [Candidatus Nanoarchaeia archaeon]
MNRGRPIRSRIRQNIVEILYFMKSAYGYEIYKVYVDIFPSVTMRSIYYHLKKGLSLKEFKISKIKSEKGDYSWGLEAEKTYYSLDANAKPQIDKKVKVYFEKKPRKAQQKK